MKVTVYPCHLGTNDFGEPTKTEVHLSKVADYLREGKNGLAEKTNMAASLALGNAEVYRQHKGTLPAAVFSGTYASIPARNDTLTTHSGLITIDFDDVSDTGSLKAALTEIPEVRLCFISPSGKGIKAVVAVFPLPTNPAEHSAAWHAVVEHLSHLSAEIDVSGKDMRRMCYLAYDPYVHYRDDGPTLAWEMPEEAPEAPPAAAPTHHTGDVDVSLLDALNPDDYETWLRVGMAAKASGIPMHVWKTWSQTSTKYKAGDCERKWKSFNRTDLTWATIEQQANVALPDRAIVTIVQEDEPEPLQLPTSVFEGIFASYCDAYKGKTEVAPEYHFACLYTAIGAICGRRYYLDEVHPIYPNAYTAIVGQSALARKTTAINAVRSLLGQCAEDVYNLTALSTPEGLVNLFVPDRWIPGKTEDDEQKLIPGGLTSLTNDFGDGLMETLIARCADREGFRILLTLDEIAKMLRKAGSASSSGLMELLADMFGYPSRVQLPTRTNPLSAEYPCLTILGATTYEWFESAFQEEDIHGGIANRFLYFYDAPRHENLFVSKPPDTALLAGVAKELNGLREKFGDDPKAQLAFHWTDDALNIGSEWYAELRQDIGAEDNVFVAHAMNRADLYLKKSALLHAILSNDAKDTCITLDNIVWAMNLMDYLIRTTRAIYTEFNTSQQKRVEERILAILRKTPWQSKNAIHKGMRWASRKDVDATVDMLVNSLTLVPQQTAQTVKYAMAKDD